MRTLGRHTLRNAVCLICVANIYHATHIFADSNANHRGRDTVNNTPATTSSCSDIRIAVINGVDFHHEVLAGILHVLRVYGRRTHVYRASSNPGDGLTDIIKRYDYTYVTFTWASLRALTHWPLRYDLAVLVSPEYELTRVSRLLKHIRPRHTIAYIHNTDSKAVVNIIRTVEGCGSTLSLVTLAPHTSGALAEATGRDVAWALATFPYKSKKDCMQDGEASIMAKCMKGFAIQGKFSSSRRNYSALWEQLSARQHELSDPAINARLRIQVLGSGDPHSLHIPRDLDRRVSVKMQLNFGPFYDAIHHAIALLPLFGSDKYFTTKISSTVVTSLITGTPIIVDSRFLAVYPFFDEASVVLQGDGEHEVDAMLRALRMTARDVLAVRQAVLDVRRHVNHHALALYMHAIAEMCRSRGERRGPGWTSSVPAALVQGVQKKLSRVVSGLARKAVTARKRAGKPG